MSAIDVQNAKQIRDPMDVLITLSLGTDIAMTYSGYSSAKVADGVLNQSSWPMRGLADLQGNGFPLDGSRVLYNPNTSPSQTNGKLGVRGNVGQPVSVTATGNDTIAALAITVTGAASVTLSGRTTEITGNRVTLQLLNTTAALTFQPSSEDRRIEIITALPEADFVINNDNLIKATVSLRSDLSIIDPTLPESELNVEVYQDDDVSEAVASIPEDTPITYQAGYPRDMSPVRKFYVSGQVTWADNVLSIHAVDAVHFLDITPGVAWWIKDPLGFRWVFTALLGAAGIDAEDDWSVSWDTEPGRLAIPPGITARDTVARIIWAFRVKGPIGAYKGEPFWASYVDAGRPVFRATNETPWAKWRVFENDCTTPKKAVEKKIDTFRISTKRLISINSPNHATPNRAGTASWVKNTGVSLSFDKLLYEYAYGVDVGDNFDSPAAIKLGDYYRQVSSAWCASAVGPGSYDGRREARASYLGGIRILMASDVSQDMYERILRAWGDDVNDWGIYTNFVPWSAKSEELPIGSRYPTTQAGAWKAYADAGVIDSGSVNMDLVICGNGFDTYDLTVTLGQRSGANAVDIEDPFWGNLISTNEGTLYPNGVYLSRLEDSPVTCSFTWKGDPRIQPRDVFTFHRLDGTDEEWTFENITITHEGGGTSTEITARKGIV